MEAINRKRQKKISLSRDEATRREQQAILLETLAAMEGEEKEDGEEVDFYDIMRYFAHRCPLEGAAEEIVKGAQKREEWVLDMLSSQEKSSRACHHTPEQFFEESQAIIRWTNCDTSAARWADSDFRGLYGNFNADKHPFLSRFHEEYISPYDLRGWGENKAGVLNNALDRCFFNRW